MKVDAIIHGRPYGGNGFICTKRENVLYKNVDFDSDRISVTEISVNSKVVCSVIGIYLPCDDHSTDSMESYLDTLDKLHVALDNCDKNFPIIVTGDLNTRLPKSCLLSDTWYRSKHFRQLYATNIASLKMPVMAISLIDKSDIKSAVNYLHVYEKLCQCRHDGVRDIKVKQFPPPPRKLP